jgi:cytochrome c
MANLRRAFNAVCDLSHDHTPPGSVHMESLEFNKIAAAILVALLLAVGIGKISNVLYAPELPEHAAVETSADAHSDADVGGGEHGDMAADVALPVLLASADLEDGEGQFKKCKSCHTVESGGSNGTGPNLFGIVGAAKEHIDGFNYSGALATVGGDWSFENLDAFLENPKAYAPGTKMTFRGISDAEDRANLIAWLNTQSDSPMALPEVEEVEAPAMDAETDADAPAMPEEPAMEDDHSATDTDGDMVDEITGEVAGAAAATMEAADDALDSVGDAIDDVADDTTEFLESDTDVADNADAGLADDASTPGGVEAMIAAGSVDDGMKVANKCKSCHTFDDGGANRVGPNLWNIVDRKVASVSDYSYSDAMAAEEGDWTYDRLWTYLQDPRGEVPGTKMGFRGITDEADLANLIAYLRSLSNDPAPLAGAQ